MKLREFNFDNFKFWFNKNFNESGFELGEGMFPDDGEIGLYKHGYEIGILVYPEGIDILNRKEFINQEFPGVVDFSKLTEGKRGNLNRECMLLPFKDKYVSIFERIAIEFCKSFGDFEKDLSELLEEDITSDEEIEIKTSLREFLEGK